MYGNNNKYVAEITIVGLMNFNRTFTKSIKIMSRIQGLFCKNLIEELNCFLNFMIWEFNKCLNRFGNFSEIICKI